VSDTFLDSAWYHLRYPSTEFHDRPFDPARTKKWLPVSSYIGGTSSGAAPPVRALHLHGAARPRARQFDSPYPKFRAHGLIVKDGAKMSKSRGKRGRPRHLYQGMGAPTRS